jgi:hypothetical protein
MMQWWADHLDALRTGRPAPETPPARFHGISSIPGVSGQASMPR